MNVIKDEKGLSYIQVVLLICLIILIVISGVKLIKVKINEEYIETIKTNMLLIQWKIKDYVDVKKASSEEITYIGTKLIDIIDSDEVKNIIEKNIIDSESLDKYYVLSDSDLQTLELEISNEENSYYIVNYETGDVLISKGCSYKENEVLYKLSDIENAKIDTANNVVNDAEVNGSEE